MKLARLGLQRFGRFTDATLEFGTDPDPAGGVHVVFGANEAGKSTTLDAIRYSLYGMPKGGSREPKYDFLHRTNEVRTQLELLLDDGSVLDFVRNRGSKVSILDPASGDQDQGRADRLASVLRGVPVELWRTRHGLNQADLRAGSKAMLEGGASADALFAAANGLGSARRVLHDIQAQRRALLADKGGSGTLHEALKELKDATRAFNEARRATGRFDAARQEYAAIESQLAAARLERATLADEHDRLTRAQGALEQLQARAVLVERCDAITGAPQAWSRAEQERLDAALRLLAEVDGHVARLTVQLATVGETISGHVVDEALLAASEAIEALNQRIGVVTQAEAQLVEWRADARRAEAALAVELASIDGGAADEEEPAALEARVAAMPTGLVLDGLRTSAEQRRALEAAVEAATRLLQDAQAQLEARRLDVSGDAVDPAELAMLEAALRVAQGIDEAALVQDEAGIANERVRLDERARRIAPASGTAAAVAALVLPSASARAALEARFEELATRRAEGELVIANARPKLAARLEKLAALEAAQDLLERSTLDALRAERDAAWAAVRAAAGNAAPVAEPLLVAVDQATVAADGYADRMVLDGERIGAANELRGEVAVDELRIAGATTTLAELDGEAAELDAAWRDLWAGTGLAIGSVEDLQVATDEVTEIGATLARIDADAVALAGRRARLDDAVAALVEAMRLPVGEPTGFAMLLARASARRDELQAAEARMQQVRGALEHIERAVRSATADLDAARATLAAQADDWRAATERVGLDAGTSTAVALGLCERYAAVADAATRARAARTVVVDAEAQRDAFTEATARVVATLAPERRAELESLDPRAAVARLAVQVGEMRTHAKVAGDAVAMQAAIEAELAEQAAARAGADADVVQLVAHAGATDLAALAVAAGCWQRRAELEDQVAALDLALLGAARMTSEEIEAVVAGRDGAELRARVDALASELTAAASRVDVLDASMRERGEAIGALKEQSAQSEARVRQQDARARLDQLVPEYRRLVLEEQLLQSLLERAAQRERGPLVERASRYLHQLTCGEWSRLVTGLDDAGNPQAQVEQAEGGALVAVEALSEGTRDQLYLALRLAALVDGAARGESMPLVVDDILLTFDNRRAVATLELLAEVSRHMQVVFLTHHEHLVELATAAIDADVLHLHRLDELVATAVG